MTFISQVDIDLVTLRDRLSGRRLDRHHHRPLLYDPLRPLSKIWEEHYPCGHIHMFVRLDVRKGHLPGPVSEVIPFVQYREISSLLYAPPFL